MAGLLLSYCLAAGVIAGDAPARSGTAPLEKIEKVVHDWFQSHPDWKPAGIITRRDAEAVLDQLEKLGWTTSERDKILDSVPTEDDFLVQQLRTAEGKKFTERIEGLPGAYDRLDHLSRLPSGKQTVRDLIHAKGGQRLIEYLTTTPGGAEMGRMLSKSPGGTQFNKPTGRIYTMPMLVERLKASHWPATSSRGR